jgi:hypothetical protein
MDRIAPTSWCFVTPWSADHVTAISTAALVLVTVAAVFVALRQLISINKSEVLKNTLRYVGFFFDGLHQVPMNEPITVMTAMQNVSLIMFSPANLASFKEWTVIYHSDPGKFTESGRKQFLLYYNSFNIAGNYFTIVAGLVAKKAVDVELFADYFHPQIRLYIKLAAELLDIDPQAKNAVTNPAIYELSAAARKAAESQELVSEVVLDKIAELRTKPLDSTAKGH